MKKSVSLLLSILFLYTFVLSSSLPVSAEVTYDGYTVYTEGDYKYIVIDNEAVIIEYMGAKDNTLIEIPSSLGGYSVTVIRGFIKKDPYEQYTNCNIIIPDTVTTLVGSVFSMDRQYLHSISTIYIPKSVVSIGEHTFDMFFHSEGGSWYQNSDILLICDNDSFAKKYADEKGYETTDRYKRFDDVVVGSWYEAAAYKTYICGTFAGTSERTFSPDVYMTRAMVVQVLAAKKGVDLSGYTASSFADVGTGKWYSAPVEWAKQEGYVAGYEDGTFKPDQPITREEFITILYNFYKGKLATGMTFRRNYSDLGDVSPYAYDAMLWGNYNNYIVGKSETTLNPKDFLTRAECAAIFS